MTQLADAPRISRSDHAVWPTDVRRWLQLALAGIWLLDGILQAQSFMFTRGFPTGILGPTASGNPAWIAASIAWSTRLVAAQPVLLNGLFAVVQVALGLGIAFRPTVRVALAGSVAWSLVVWWFGEGLGGLLTGGANVLAGAPGAVLLYAIAAVLLWPSAAVRPGALAVAERAVGPVAARTVWVVLWGGLALLNLQPANLTASAVHDTVDGMGDGQPVWVSAAVSAFTAASRGNGLWLTLTGTVLLALVAVGVLLPAPTRRVAVVLAIVVSAFVWIVGEGLGAFIGGQSTDPNSGPLLALLALAYWPERAAAAATDPADPAVRS